MIRNQIRTEGNDKTLGNRMPTMNAIAEMKIVAKVSNNNWPFIKVSGICIPAMYFKPKWLVEHECDIFGHKYWDRYLRVTLPNRKVIEITTESDFMIQSISAAGYALFGIMLSLRTEITKRNNNKMIIESLLKMVEDTHERIVHASEFLPSSQTPVLERFKADQFAWEDFIECLNHIEDPVYAMLQFTNIETIKANDYYYILRNLKDIVSFIKVHLAIGCNTPKLDKLVELLNIKY